LIFFAEELQMTATVQEELQDSDPKILSKKEKEKLKKEREKVWQVPGTLQTIQCLLFLGKKESSGCSKKSGGGKRQQLNNLGRACSAYTRRTSGVER